MADFFERGPLRMRKPAFEKPDSDSVDLGMIARGFWKDRMIFLAVTLLCGLIAAILVSQVTPKYISVTQVLLDPREQRLVISERVVSDRQLNDQVIGSEMSIIRSNILLEAVIDRLDAQDPDALAMIDTANKPASVFKHLKSYVKNLVLGPPEPSAADAEAQRLARLDRLTWAIRRSMDTWRDGDSYVISIAIETPDPALSMLLAGAIAEQYVLQQLEGQRLSSSQAADWIELRVEDLREEVKTAEDAVEDYRAGSIEATGASLDIISQRLVSLNDELIGARVARVTAESRANEIERVIAEEGFDAIGGMFTSPQIVALNTQRLDILAADAQWAERFDASHPERRRLEAQLTEVNRALVAETQLALDAQRNEVQIARIREQTMNESLQEAEQQFLAISRSAIGLRQLEREAEVARNMYTDLLNRYTETRTKEQLQQADARIIERANLPGAPSSPRPKLMTLLGLLVGAALGAAIVMFRQVSKSTYASISELEKDTGLPVFSTLPERKWKNIRDALKMIETERLGPSAESIRKLRNAVLNSDEEAEAHSITLLSALQNEGKTTTTMLLARMIARADKLVVVVDCDFRQNSIQKEFNFRMERDFGDYLSGDCTVLEALNTETGLGFDLVATRDAQPQAADVLTTGILAGMLDELKKYYDVVLVNCPAVLPAAEALVIARAVDQRVMLVRFNTTPRSAVKRCLTILENNELQVSGQVLTRVDPDMMRDSDVYSYDT